MNRIYRIWLVCLVGLVGANASYADEAAEDWKGKSETSEVSFGALAGMGLIDSNVGFSLLGTASKKIIKSGFAKDMSNSVSIEAALGPVFIAGTTALAFSGHLRWDFQKDDKWTFYALGGLGGNMLSVNSVNRFELFPRFGIGSFYSITTSVRLRAEVTHDLIGIGVNFPF